MTTLRNVPPLPNLTYSDSTIFIGNALDVLRRLDSDSIQAIITSPPYWGVRNYGIEGQIGLESTLEQYINKLLGVFIEAKRVLRKNGSLWLNMGDIYTSGNRGYRAPDRKNPARSMLSGRPDTPEGLKRKDLIGLPWRIAFALQNDGWYLRSDVIWHKPNAMPESVKDRPVKSHEYLFLLTKSENYYYNDAEVKEKGVTTANRSLRSVWSVNTTPFSGKHFATFPPALIKPCILASTKQSDFILDPFFGAGTLGLVCQELERHFLGIELNPEYAQLAADRLGVIEQNILQLVG